MYNPHKKDYGVDKQGMASGLPTLLLKNTSNHPQLNHNLRLLTDYLSTAFPHHIKPYKAINRLFPQKTITLLLRTTTI